MARSVKGERGDVAFGDGQAKKGNLGAAFGQQKRGARQPE